MKKEKTIQTPELTIKGNIMLWEDTAIQLSNISSVSTVPLASMPFPFWVILPALIGFTLIDEWFAGAIIMLIVACGIIFIWYLSNEERKTKKNLIIHMNSGMTFSFLFYKKEFLEKVFNVLNSIISENGKAAHNIKIDINKSVISNSNVLNGLTGLNK